MAKSERPSGAALSFDETTSAEALVDALDTLIDKGAVLEGDLELGLTDVAFVRAGLRLYLTAVRGSHEEYGIGAVRGSAPDRAGDMPDRAGEVPGATAPGRGSDPRARDGGPSRPATSGERAAVDGESGRTESSASSERSAENRRSPPIDGERRNFEETEEPRELTEGEAKEWLSDPKNSERDPTRGLAHLVLLLVDVLRRLMERQALRRVEEGGLREDRVEELGQIFASLEERMAELEARFAKPRR